MKLWTQFRSSGRFQPSRITVVFFLLIVVAPILSLVGGSHVYSAERVRVPNIVLIMADDLGIECLPSYGGTDYETPFLDVMALTGMRFTHAYSQPLCSPTRLELMTGRDNHRNWQSFGILTQGEKTFGHLMSNAGFKTCLAGKWQLTSYDPPEFPGSGRRRGTGTHPKDAGFDEYSLFHAEETEDKGSRYANPTFLRNGKLHREVAGAYGEDLTVEFILDFMKRHRDEPQFVYYPMALPHWPMVPTPHSKVWNDSNRRLEEATDYFPDMVAYMDHTIKTLVHGIEELGLREQTLVLFYSDNGTDRRIQSKFRGQTIPGGKGAVTQNGIRVPLIAWWPGTIESGVCDDLIDPSDFLPTLAELAKTEIPTNWQTDGVSFAPQLFGEKGSPREWAFFWYDPRPGWDKEKFSRHVFALDQRYKLFSDGRLFDIRGTGFREVAVNTTQLTDEQRAAQTKLQAAIDQMMQPPLSPRVHEEVDAFGEPVKAR
ncbi:sulfatase-like hydrolase/transferase [Thalassoroseus pseudoceratinae]|uniref:sulfatase-like hydrolase/transferase n=1 Tax=Thalassoroseus pseudoceratinae TaxID=2713176 RepID=UPI00141E4FDE|nr:sulfatase-like hydrolase/transferase [Thalassoroseus pseudoceratinae]